MFTFLDPTDLKKLCTAFVRLEHGQMVWAPFLKKQINLIENVQIRATKLVEGLENYKFSLSA